MFGAAFAMTSVVRGVTGSATQIPERPSTAGAW